MKLEIIGDNCNCFLFGEVNGSLNTQTSFALSNTYVHTNIKIAKLSSKRKVPNFFKNPYYKNKKILLPVKILSLIEM